MLINTIYYSVTKHSIECFKFTRLFLSAIFLLSSLVTFQVQSKVSGFCTSPLSQTQGETKSTTQDPQALCPTPTPTPIVVLPPSWIDVPGTDADGTFKISWASSTNAATYQLEQKLEAGKYSLIISTKNLSFTTKSLPDGSYYFRVKGCNSSSICGTYKESTVVIVGDIAPSTPESVSIPSTSAKSSHSLDIIIGKSEPYAERYEVQSKIINGTQSYSWIIPQVIQPAPSLPAQMVVVNVANGTYQYRARGCNGTACSNWRTSSNITINVVVADATVDPVPAPHIQPLPEPDTISDSIGAIAGEFRVDEGGQANYTIPIMTPKGSGGVSPSVSINYNSGSGNGQLGLGWSLNATSSITRCRRTAEQDGVGNDGDISLSYDDVFCLDGKRLIVINSIDYGTNGAEYRTAIDSQTRIISYGVQGSGPSYFEVWRKDGTKTTYGTSDDTGAELVANNNGVVQTTVVSWFTNKVIDSSLNGNPIIYDYSIDNTQNEVSLKSISYAP